MELRKIAIVCGIISRRAMRRGSFTSIDDLKTKRLAFLDCFNHNVMTRVTGDIIALSPPLIIETHQIDELVGTLSDAIRHVS